MSKYTLDPQSTLAILIGIAEYTGFQNIEPAPNNVTKLAEILQDESIFGLPESHIKTLIGGTSNEIKLKAFDFLEDAKKRGIKTLIFYFAGHGYRHSSGTYFLVAEDTRKSLINLDGSSGLPFKTIETLIQKSRIQNSIIIIDACFSGLATQSDDQEIPELDLRGTYILSSSSGREVSYFDSDHQHTLFTGELIHLFENGVEGEGPHVTLSALYHTLSKTVKKKNAKMSPQQKASQEVTGDNFYFFKNRKRSNNPGPEKTSGQPGSPSTKGEEKQEHQPEKKAETKTNVSNITGDGNFNIQDISGGNFNITVNQPSKKDE